MDSDTVAMFLPEEPERDRRRCKPGRRFFCILALVAFFTLTILFSVVLSLSVMNTNKYESLKEQYVGNGELQPMIDNRINDSEFTWKRKVDVRLASIDRNLLNQVQADEVLRTHVNNSFENITNDVENLISSVDHLTTRLLRVNSSSARKMLHLRNTLTVIKDDLSQTRAVFTKVNESLRDDLSQTDNSFRAAVKDLKDELGKLLRSTTADNNELWDHVNKTSSEFKQALDDLAHHNTTLHLTVKYRASVFNSKLDMVKKRLDLLSKNTTNFRKKYLKDVEIMMNKTRSSLEETFRKAILKTDTDMSKKIKNSETQLKSLLLKVEAKIENVKNQLATDITDLKERQANITDDLSKTKINFDVVDSRRETNISALADKIKRITNVDIRLRNDLNAEKEKGLKLEEDIKDLRAIVDKHLANGNAENLRMNTSLILVLLVSILIYF